MKFPEAGMLPWAHPSFAYANDNRAQNVLKIKQKTLLQR
jgi:hypothetical protein